MKMRMALAIDKSIPSLQDADASIYLSSQCNMNAAQAARVALEDLASLVETQLQKRNTEFGKMHERCRVYLRQDY